MNRQTILMLLITVTLPLASCATETDVGDSDGEVIDVPFEAALAADEGKADGVAIPFTLFADEVNSTRKSYETRRMFTSAADYRAFFGRSAPAAVDFSRDWVVFYASGSKPVGGYSVAIRSIALNGNRLEIMTSLTSPGAGCAPRPGPVAPFVLAKFRRQNSGGLPVTYLRADTTVFCAVSSCSVVACPSGQTCSMASGRATCATPARDTVTIPTTTTCRDIPICINGTECHDTNGRAACYEPTGDVASFPNPGYHCGQMVCPNGMWCIEGSQGGECKSPRTACRICNPATTTCRSPSYNVQCVPLSGGGGSN